MPSSSLRVGVDLVRVADVTASIARFGARYTERLFTAGERAYCDADVLHDGATALARRSGITELSLSMSHEQDYATATVVACFAPVGDATRSRG